MDAGPRRQGLGPPSSANPVTGRAPLAVFGLAVACLALLLAPLASGHGAVDDDAEERLRQASGGWMMADLEMPQPGALVIVPYVDGPLPCGAATQSPYRIEVAPTLGVTFASNATHVELGASLAGADRGFLAVALDTGEVVRSLILMEEKAVQLHAAAALVYDHARGGAPAVREGVLGVPHDIPGTMQHGFYHGSNEAGPQLAYTEGVQSWEPCNDPAGDYVGVRIRRDVLEGRLGPGGLVHAFLLHDPVVADFLPRAVETTRLEPFNLYLARPGEDAADLRRAFDPAASAQEVVPLVLVSLASAVTARRR